MRKEHIDIFGEESIAVVEHNEGDKYSIRRVCDDAILAIGYFSKYKGCEVRTMYTGDSYATGDYILEVDNGNYTDVIYVFTD